MGIFPPCRAQPSTVLGENADDVSDRVFHRCIASVIRFTLLASSVLTLAIYNWAFFLSVVWIALQLFAPPSIVMCECKCHCVISLFHSLSPHRLTIMVSIASDLRPGPCHVRVCRSQRSPIARCLWQPLYASLTFLSFTGLLSAWSPAQPSIPIAFVILPWATTCSPDRVSCSPLETPLCKVPLWGLLHVLRRPVSYRSTLSSRPASMHFSMCEPELQNDLHICACLCVPWLLTLSL